MKTTFLGVPALALVLALSTGCEPPAGGTRVATFDSNGVDIRYAEAGSGTPIVLLHGWMGEASSWGGTPQTGPKLKPPPGFRLVALDQRGHGESGKPHDPAAYGKEMAKDVVRLMDHLGIDKAHLVGYSMGAYVAGKAVELAPRRFRSVVYGGSSPVLKSRAVAGFSQAEAFADAVDEGKGMGRYLLSLAPEGSPKATLDQANAAAERMFAGKDLKALAAVGRSFRVLEADGAKLAASKVPALLIYGEQESQFVRDRIAEARLALPTAEVVVIPGTNHITALTHPDFGAKTLAFLKRH